MPTPASTTSGPRSATRRAPWRRPTCGRRASRPRELRLLAAAAGLEVEHIWSVTPGAYEAAPPRIDTPELLLVARRP